MRHVMLDLETLGTLPGSVILAIGAVEFNGTELGETFLRTISLKSSLGLGLKIQAETLEWWIQQDPAVLQAQFKDAVSVFTAATDFRNWFNKEPDRVVWGNGASFDMPLLEAMYTAMQAGPPWTYRNQMCVRTILKVADVKIIAPSDKHNALSDAVAQAQAVQVACDKLKVLNLLSN